jgi:hypothetical protein
MQKIGDVSPDDNFLIVAVYENVNLPISKKIKQYCK